MTNSHNEPNPQIIQILEAIAELNKNITKLDQKVDLVRVDVTKNVNFLSDLEKEVKDTRAELVAGQQQIQAILRTQDRKVERVIKGLEEVEERQARIGARMSKLEERVENLEDKTNN